MATMALSWDHIQKIKNKAVKESIVAQWQSRYSRNLWSSSFAWTLYDRMEVNLTTGSNQFNFVYIPRNQEDTQKEDSFTDKFEIKYITVNYDMSSWNLESLSNITLQYEPYKIYCNISWEEWNSMDNMVLIVRVNDSQDYCFEIQSKNCRLVEVSQSRCDSIMNIWSVSD